MKRLLFIICIGILIISSVGCNPNTPEVTPNPENNQPSNKQDNKEVSPEEEQKVDPADSSILSQETLTGSAQIIKMYEEIEDAEVTVEEDKLTFYLIPTNQEVPKERLRELGILFIKALAGYTVNEELQGPNDESYGEIYDYYDAEIIVEEARGDVLYRGTKSKREDEIQWQE